MTEAAPMALADVRSLADAIRAEVGKAVVGQADTVDGLLIALMAQGHVLLEGPPGTAKTFLAQCFAATLGLHFGRIQFTPDLMPGDILGSNLFNFQTSQFTLTRGPIFCDLLLADEINRTPPKTQAALLQGMQERQVSAGNHHYKLPSPFFVLATQNPIEQEGTYPLPEAQLDRFIMKIIVGYPTKDEERKIYRAMTGAPHSDPTPTLTGEEVIELQNLIRRVPISDLLVDYTMAIVRATRKDDPESPEFVRNWVLWGVGPRGGQSMILAAKARAALYGRPEVTVEDLKAVAVPVLRHRIVLSYNAEAEGQSPDTVIRKLVDSVPVHASPTTSDPQVQRALKG